MLACGPVPPAASDERATRALGLEEARHFLLGLVNRDREAAGLEPVEADEFATLSGQRHADDMAERGFTAHFGSDGSVPEQRYTEAGGLHLVRENAACFVDAVTRPLDPAPRFDPELLERTERAFLEERPPNDGQRKNVLAPTHTHLGVGLAKPRGVRELCLTEEFVDEYGDFEPLPTRAKPGDRLRISGRVQAPAVFGAVGIGRAPLPSALEPRALNRTSTYRVPGPYATHFAEGFATPEPVSVDGNRFFIELVLPPGQVGLYSVSVWVHFPGLDPELSLISLRTIVVE